MRAAALVLALAGCPELPVVHQADKTYNGPPDNRPPPIDAAVTPPSQEEILAGIQKAMNDLDPAAHQCWAAAAVERFDIEGNLELRIAIDDKVAVDVVTDTTRNGLLVTCMKTVLEHYGWAPPLHGQTIQLPFQFRAPDGQSVIDRELEPRKVQDTIAVKVLLDENNTGNEAASMVEVTIAAGGDTRMREVDRDELWYFRDPAEVSVVHGTKAGWDPVAAGDMMLVRAHQIRDVRATANDVHAVVVYVPGGREGTARAGALPGRETTGKPQVTILPASAAKTYGPATIFLDKSIVKDAPLAASALELPVDATVPEHVHDKETELLYVFAGGGTMTVGNVSLPVTGTSVIQIPAGTKHSFAANKHTSALQIYTPAGPEQRFKK
jgi:quercetin dioxygenase-like cupin family protein